MRTLAYSPSVEAYACAIGKGGSRRYIDLSPDIIDCSVSITSNASSKADISLANRGGKYNGVFEPMDLITVFACKGEERVKLFTGYMTKVSAWTLRPDSFSISAKDIIYRLQNLYWDKGLDSSVELMSNESSNDMDWMGYEGEIIKLLTTVGGVNPDSIIVDQVPDRMIEYARAMYEGQRADVDSARSVDEEFYEILRNASQGLSGASTQASGTSANLPGAYESVASNDQQRRLVSSAYSTPTAGAGRCAAWVYNVYQNAGLTYYPAGNANDLVRNFCHTSDKSQLKVGMMIGGKNTGVGLGAIYGHIGIYVGNGTVRHNLSGVVQDWELDRFINLFVDQCKWGFPPNIASIG